MFKSRKEKRKSQSFNRMIPNILTMLALCAGLTSLRFGIEGKWEAAVASIIVAGVLDALDGRIARLIRGTSKFGAELDSLSDFLAFGIAPAVLLFLWTMKESGPIGWVLVLLFAVCCALRLARFNTDMDSQDLPLWTNNFFTGVPAPAGGGLALLPIIISFQIENELIRNPQLVGILIVVISALMVSKIPTYSFKRVRVPHKYVLLTMLFVGLIAAFAVGAPWLTITILLISYIISLPLGYRSFKKLQKEHGDQPVINK